MKKSLLFVLALPLLLASCTATSSSSNPFSSTPQTSDADDGNQSQQGGTQTGGNTDHGTEGSGTGTTTGGGTETGGGTTAGGGTETGGGTTTGGGTETGSGQTTGGGTETTSTSVEKDMSQLGLTNGNKPSSINVNNEITLLCDVGTNTNKNAPAYYESDSSLRFYPNNTLKFTNSKGVITKIELNYTGNSFSAINGQINEKTWTGSASEVTLKAEGSSGNAKLFSFKVTYGTSGGGTTTGGGTETGSGTETGGGTTTGGGTETGGGGGTVTTGDYTSTWPSNYQQYVITYFNGAIPCFLNTNKKCLFNQFETGTEESSGLPFFNPQIKNTSPSINYEYDYGVILRDAGFKNDGDDVDEGVTWHNYSKGYYEVRFAKYRGTDNIYYFDCYMFYNYENTTTFTNTYTFQYDDKDLGLTNRYESNNKTITVKNWTITLTDIQKSSYYMQLKKDTGNIVIKGNIKGVYLGILRNSDAAFVKAGTSSSNAKYVFNNGYRFDFPQGTTYVEISAQSRVLEFEFFEIGY